MTRRDYEKLAGALSRAMLATLDDPDGKRRAGIALATVALADTLREDNYRFNREKFLAASGVSENAR
jgi:hypothetical protein